MSTVKPSAPDTDFVYNEPPPPYSAMPYPPTQAMGAPPGIPPSAGFAPYPGQGPVQGPYGAAGYSAPPVGQPARTVIVNPKLGAYPANVTCPKCGKTVQTRTYASPGLLTFIMSGIFCVVGLFCGCCLIPFCIRECQNIEHHCPSCKTFLGIYRRI